MAKRSNKKDVIKCSFCGETASIVGRIIVGHECNICENCVEICEEIFLDGFQDDMGCESEEEILMKEEAAENTKTDCLTN